MKRLIVLLAVLASPVCAADTSPRLRTGANLAKNAQAFPTLVGAGRAIGRINRALRAANARQLKDMADCLRDAPQDGFWWEQDVDASLLGARFVSFYRHGTFSCGGAHPSFIMEPQVFDLRSGEKADWRKLLPAALFVGSAGELASPALKALFVAQSVKESPPECADDFAQELQFELWPDAKEKGLAMHTFSLPGADQGVCGGPVTIPLDELRRLGVDADLIRDIETSGRQP